ncbi:MAG: mannose-1-phosphate guanylyltransferase [Patescibacteria group bacterium]
MERTKYKDHLFALVIVGGGGTRLWPKSRNGKPKQFLRLFAGKTLTQISAYRFAKLLPWEKIFFVTTTEDYKKEILKEVPEVNHGNVIVEPLRRNTAPAHALGALFISKKDPDAVIINEYADHLMIPESRYLSVMKAAGEAAYSEDILLATGIKPTYPNVGYGYIKRGQKLKIVGGKTIYKVERFTEKPQLALAEKYLASGEYFWNAGQYAWRADAILSAFKKHAPEIYKNLKPISEAIGTREQDGAIRRAYAAMPEISVDYAISEKANNFIMVIADYEWTDIGDWKEVWENLPKDALGNVIIQGDEPGGEVVNLDTSDALVHVDGRLVALVDVDNIIVVDTKDALLVASKSRAQNVKKIVEILKEQKRKELL